MNARSMFGLAMVSVLLITVQVRGNPAAGISRAQTFVHPHRQLRHILAQPPFQQWRWREKAQASPLHNPLEQAISKQWDRFVKWLRRIFFRHHHQRPIAGGNFSGPPFSIATFLEIMGWIVGILLVVGILMVLFRWWPAAKTKSKSASSALSRNSIGQAMEQGDALAMASDSWMSAAQQFGSEGNFRAMYRAMYLSLLSGLHQAGKIRFRRNRTNWYYVHDFHGQMPERQLFGTLTDLFDHVWYGRKLYPGLSADTLRQQIHLLCTKIDQPQPVAVPGHAPLRQEDAHA